MTKRTRLFLMVGSGILVIGLGTGLVASYMGGLQNWAIGGDGPDELAYVPADVRFVAFANVRDVMNSQVRQRLSALHPGSDSGADRFREQTGIDVQTDIDYVVAAHTGAASDPVESGPPLVLARGRFDEVRIEGLIRAQGGVVEDYKGERLLVHGEQRLAVVFLEPGLAGIGTSAAVRAAIDTKAAGPNVRSNVEMMRLVRDIDDGDAWVVTRFDALTGTHLPPEVVNQLPPINWFAARGAVNGGVEGQLRVETRDEASAQNLQDVIRGFMALGRLQTSQHPQLAAVLDSVQLTGLGTSVSLSFSIPPELIDALGAARAQRPAPAPPRPEPPPVPPTL